MQRATVESPGLGGMRMMPMGFSGVPLDAFCGLAHCGLFSASGIENKGFAVGGGDDAGAGAMVAFG